MDPLLRPLLDRRLAANDVISWHTLYRCERRYNEPVFPESYPLPSTKGFIYLTDALELAVRYGIKAAAQEIYAHGHVTRSRISVCVFCVNIDENIIELDTDEMRMMFPDQIQQLSQLGETASLSDYISIIHSVRVPKKLILCKDIIRYLLIDEPRKQEWLWRLESCQRICRLSNRHCYNNLLVETMTSLPWQTISDSDTNIDIAHDKT